MDHPRRQYPPGKQCHAIASSLRDSRDELAHILTRIRPIFRVFGGELKLRQSERENRRLQGGKLFPAVPISWQKVCSKKSQNQEHNKSSFFKLLLKVENLNFQLQVMV